MRKDTGAKLALSTSSIVDDRFTAGARAAGVEVLTTDEIDLSGAGDFIEPSIESDLAYLQYTSGSTSTPRGVMITHQNVLQNLASIDDGFEHTAESVAVSWLPHFHDMGLIYGLLGPLYVGMPCYFMPPGAFVQRPRFWLETITKYRATHSGGPNFAYDLCVRRIGDKDREELDLSSWEVAFNGAEPIHAETLARFSKAFAGCGFRSGAFDPAYGLAEASLKVSGGSKLAEPKLFRAEASALSQNRVEPAGKDSANVRTMVGCGVPGRDTEIVIANPDTLRPAAPAEVGEIWVSGPGVAKGYWNRPEETRPTFQAHLAGDESKAFLRTGDLGFLRDGELFVAGRLKDLIIIRGLNHHPGDLELTARRAHPDVSTSIAAAFSIDADGNERLVLVMEAGRHEPTDLEAVARAIRQAVAEKHETLVYAVVLVRKGTIPKTSSGKIQRRLCRSLYLDGQLNAIYENVVADAGMGEAAAGVDREKLLAVSGDERRELIAVYLRGILARAFKADPDGIGAGKPLTSYGIDSLMAMELQNRVETDLGVAVTAVELLEGATLNDLIAIVMDGMDAGWRGTAAIAVRKQAEAPLSFQQERLWLLDKITPGNAAYHVPFGFRVRGPLEVAVLERSLDMVCERQSSLRTSFVAGNGGPRSVVGRCDPVKVQIHDLSALPESDRKDEALAAAQREIRRPFDLEKGPLFRFSLFRLTETDHLALVVMHHIVSDLWSVRLFVDDLLAAYQMTKSGENGGLEPLPVEYGDFAVWQREQLHGEELERLVEYWRSKLEGAPRLELPTDHPRPAAPSFEGGTESIAFPADLAEAAQQFCLRENVTLFTLLLSAFEALAARCSGQTDLVVGTTSANRNRPELERLIGFFAAPLVVRTRLSEDLTFLEAIGRVRQTLLEAYAHQELPFAKVVEAAHPGRQSSYTPLFQVMFSVVKSLLPATETPDLDLEALELGTDSTDFDLFINIIDEPRALRALVVYSKDLYDAETVRRLMAAYLDVLRQGVRRPQTLLSDLEAPSELTRQAAAEAEVRKARLAITATFTSEPVEEILSFWMRETGVDYEVRFAPYNQVYQQLLDPASLTGRNSDGVNVILIRLEDWARGTHPAGLAKLEENVRNFIEALTAAGARSPVPFLVCLCPASPDFRDVSERKDLQERLEDDIASAFAATNTVHVVNSTEIQSAYQVAEYYDPHGERLGHVPYTPEFFAALGTMIARKIHVMRTAPYKVIALDCDQTLWSGVCGEDGPAGVIVDQPRRDLQKFMLEQRDAGMLLTIASKNNEEDVWAVFEAQPDMPLRKEHFVAWRINWESKSEGLREMADELQLGLDSFMLVDDSPTECAEVGAAAPDVLTLQLPKDMADLAAFLHHVWAFDHLGATEEDKQRSAMYGQRLERRKLQTKTGTIEEFLSALELKVDIGPMTAAELPRVSQLTQRTNQLNLTTIRRTEGEIRTYLQDGECLTVHVSDRFGDYGLVGVVLFKEEKDALAIDTLLLSCRALGRGVEHQMLARTGQLALERGKRAVKTPYVKTAKNRPALKFIESAVPKIWAGVRPRLHIHNPRGIRR